MSNAVLPSLPGLMWDVVKTPQWDTLVQQTRSGKEIRASYYSSPIRRWALKYDILRQGSVNGTTWSELATLAGFFNSRQGRFDSFLYADPTDSSVTAEPFGTGDGSTTAFQLKRAWGGFSENVYDLNGTPTIFRNDWQGNTLLTTAARTNLLTFSEQLDNAAWTKSNTTVTANATTAPDGTTTADKLVESSAASVSHFTRPTAPTLADSTSYSVSIYAKAAERSIVYVQTLDKANNTKTTWFNLGSGTVGTTASGHTASIVSMGSGWYRCAVTFNSATGATSPLVLWGLTTADNVVPYTGDGTSGAYLWGAQCEAANAPTSYIGPTTSSAVTRTDYTLSSTGLVTLAVAPLTGAALTWTGAYYFRVRFDSDAIEFTNFLAGYWHSGAIAFVQVK